MKRRKGFLKRWFTGFLILVLAGFWLGFVPWPAFQVARAAEVNINTDLFDATSEYNPSPNVVFTTDQIGYAFYIDQTGDEPRYKKTTDGGGSWGSEVDLGADLNWANIAVWYDQWTPGDSSGTYIYMVAVEASTDDVWYKRLNTSDDALSPTGTTWTQVRAGTTYTANSFGNVAVTKATDGTLFVTTPLDTATLIYKSADGSTWAAENGGSTGGTTDEQDITQLFPVYGGDVMWVIHDISATDLEYELYDSSADSWSAGSIDTNFIQAVGYLASWGGATHKASGNIYIVGNNDVTRSTADIKTYVWDDVARSWSTATDVYSNDAGPKQATIAIDQRNGDLYAFYARGTAGSESVYYKKSTDAGSSWGSESSAVSSTADDLRYVRTNFADPERIYVTWYNDDLNYIVGGTVDLDYSAEPNMYLFLDSGDSIPTGWSAADTASDDFYQKFVRGAEYYNATQGTGQATHDHDISFVSATGGSGSTSVGQPLAAPGMSPSDATEAPSAISSTSINTATTLPPWRYLRVITLTAGGIPTTIPTNAIAIFDSAPSGSWTRYTSQDGYFLRAQNSSGNDGGSNTDGHTHSGIGFSADTPDTTVNPPPDSGATSFASNTHTHSVSSQTNSAATGETDLPPHIDVLLYKATADVAPPSGLIAMFDNGTLPASWDQVSDIADTFDEKFMKSESAYDASSQGAGTHTHANQQFTTGGPSGTTALDTAGPPPTTTASDTSHTHSVTVSYGSARNAPVWIDVVLAKKTVNFIPKSEDWRWYDADDTTDPANTNGSENTAGDAIEDENTTNSSTRIIYNENTLKLRLKIAETGGAAQNNIRFKIQYSESSTFASAVSDVGPQGATALLFQYADGAGTDDATIGAARLSGSPSLGTHNEATSASTFDFSASTTYEFEFTINNNNAPANRTWYFRAYDTVNDAAVPLNTSESYPYLTTAASYDLEVSTVPSTIEMSQVGNEAVTTWGGTNSEWGFWDKRGNSGKYNVQISATAVDLVGGGDSIPVTDEYWYSKITDFGTAFDSDKTNMTGMENYLDLSTTRNAYQDDNTTSVEGDGGFIPAPSYKLDNLSSRTSGIYTGTLTLTIVAVP